jgi:hypothetical protein
MPSGHTSGQHSAATSGFLLNTALLLAGTTSTSPVLAVLGRLLILA